MLEKGKMIYNGRIMKEIKLVLREMRLGTNSTEETLRTF